MLIKSNNANGSCYIETKNLDGETNLKIKEAVKGVNAAIATDRQATGLKGKIVCEGPNPHLYRFEGAFEFSGLKND